jgi:2-polyprenyl-6-methoxyphenol hydroxylase-like FAD-dependent oxidoreductase
LDAQVLIVGGGPTGFSLACHLLRLGVRVRIIDKKSSFSTTSKAIGLQYRASEIPFCAPHPAWARQRKDGFLHGGFAIAESASSCTKVD